MFNPNLTDDEIRYRVRPQVADDAQEDNTTVRIAPSHVTNQQIELDEHCFPTRESLEAWHEKNNPHLFGK